MIRWYFQDLVMSPLSSLFLPIKAPQLWTFIHWLSIKAYDDVGIPEANIKDTVDSAYKGTGYKGNPLIRAELPRTESKWSFM